MKKKIGDLTKEEIKKICDKYLNQHEICCDCPLQTTKDDACLRCLDLDKEIEVEE